MYRTGHEDRPGNAHNHRHLFVDQTNLLVVLGAVQIGPKRNAQRPELATYVSATTLNYRAGLCTRLFH